MEISANTPGIRYTVQIGPAQPGYSEHGTLTVNLTAEGIIVELEADHGELIASSATTAQDVADRLITEDETPLVFAAFNTARTAVKDIQ